MVKPSRKMVPEDLRIVSFSAFCRVEDSVSFEKALREFASDKCYSAGMTSNISKLSMMIWNKLKKTSLSKSLATIPWEHDEQE